MIPVYVPPPPEPVPAEIQTINADQQQRLESPEQYIDRFNQEHHGDGIKANINQPEEAQPDNAQKAQDLIKGIEGIGEGLGSLAEARNKGKQREDENSAMNANKNVASGTDPDPSPSPEKTASENTGQSAASAPGEDDGYDYYSGYGY